jgi:hypothetical protein
MYSNHPTATQLQTYLGNLLQPPMSSGRAPHPQSSGGSIRFGNANSMAPYASKIQSSPSTVFLGDLPRDTCLVELYEYLKRVVGGDFELVLKR